MTKPKPVAWFHPIKNGGYQITPTKKYPKDQPLYSAREWIGLTDVEFAEILCDDKWQRRPELMILAAQAKLKEKNGN